MINLITRYESMYAIHFKRKDYRELSEIYAMFEILV